MAHAALRRAIGGEPVNCSPRATDGYGRTVAVCTVAGRDLGESLVAQGWAVAYTRYSGDYVGVEKRARAGKRGVWAYSFAQPWTWRSGR